MKKQQKPCEWCGSSKHNSKNCRISDKHALLLEGVSPHDAGFVVLDCGNMDELVDKIDAVHTLLS